VIELDTEAHMSVRVSFQIYGKMVDVPVVVRAQYLIRRFNEIQQREMRKLAATG
jgi:citrate lyase beta subunit